MIFSSTRKSQLMIFTSRVRAHAIVLFTDLSSTFISHLRQALHYDYKSFVRKQSQVSPLMQDILLCTIGIGILFTLIFIKQDTIPFYFVLSMGTAVSVGGILLALVTILKACLSARASAFKALYGVRIEAHQKGCLLYTSRCV